MWCEAFKCRKDPPAGHALRTSRRQGDWRPGGTVPGSCTAASTTIASPDKISGRAAPVLAAIATLGHTVHCASWRRERPDGLAVVLQRDGVHPHAGQPRRSGNFSSRVERLSHAQILTGCQGAVGDDSVQGETGPHGTQRKPVQDLSSQSAMPSVPRLSSAGAEKRPPGAGVRNVRRARIGSPCSAAQPHHEERFVVSRRWTSACGSKTLAALHRSSECRPNQACRGCHSGQDAEPPNPP